MQFSSAGFQIQFTITIFVTQFQILYFYLHSKLKPDRMLIDHDIFGVLYR